MPFSPNASIISTDLDNMLRGLNRDNADHAVSGTLVETNMASFVLPANTVGQTGGIFVHVVGSAIGAGGAKTVRLYIGASLLIALAVPAGNQCWFMKLWMYNTSNATQKMYAESGSIPAVVGVGAAPVLTYYLFNGLADTTQNQTLKSTCTLASAGDTLTNSMWNVYVVQIQ